VKFEPQLTLSMAPQRLRSQARRIFMLMRCSSDCCVRTVLFESIWRKRLQEASATTIFESVSSAIKLATGCITSIQGSMWDARRSRAANSLGRSWWLACLGRSTWSYNVRDVRSRSMLTWTKWSHMKPSSCQNRDSTRWRTVARERLRQPNRRH